MTLAAYRASAAKLRDLRGTTCVGAGTDYAFMLVLDFERIRPHGMHGVQESPYSLVCECWWRLERREDVIAGSGDEQAAIEARIAVLRGRRLEDVETFLPSYTARLAFDGGLALWIFPDDSRQLSSEGGDVDNADWYVISRALVDGREA